MEKRTPHCKLSAIQEMVRAGKVRATRAAQVGGADLGFDFDGLLDVVLSLKMTDFYKSMTTYQDHTIWQDVYRPMTKAGEVYLKLTVVEDVLIVSFKEL